MSGPASIAIVEDHLPTALLWAKVVRRNGWHCAGRFADAESAWKVLRRHPPTLVLLDWELRGRNGGWLAPKLRALQPPVGVLILTCHDEPAVLIQAIGVPVNGFIRKPVGPAELVARIREVLAGQMPLATQHGAVLCPAPVPAAGSPMALLSEREREIVLCGARGDSDKETADQLQIAVTTVRTHKERIVTKLDARNFREAVARAAGFLNWYPPSPPPPGTVPSDPRAGA